MSNSSPSSPLIDLKIVVLGGGGVGKTSFIHRYTSNEFSDTTLAAAHAVKKWANHHFAIWDTAGQEKFSKVSSYYCRGADAAIIAYDLTEANSFHHLESYLEQYRKSEPKGLVVIIGTKLDIVLENPEMRQVNPETAKMYADSVGAVLYETSARNNINVDIVFNYIGTILFPGSSPLIAAEQAASSPSTDANNNFSNHRRREDSCCCLQ